MRGERTGDVGVGISATSKAVGEDHCRPSLILGRGFE
jgi:hypothetical protein